MSIASDSMSFSFARICAGEVTREGEFLPFVDVVVAVAVITQQP